MSDVKLPSINSTCKIQLKCHCTFSIQILFCSWVRLSPVVPALAVWWGSLLILQPAVAAPDDRQVGNTGGVMTVRGISNTVLEKDLSECHFVHHKSLMDCSGNE
jgi:hypothetical protein